MEYKFSDLIDIRQIQILIDNFCKIVGVASAIIDFNGKVLISSRWQRICTDFHRVNVQTCEKCIESDTILANQLLKGKKYAVYQCKNGLIDAAVPIVVKGKHIANMFIGQFLHEPPNIEFFKKQASDYGFNKTSYLKALSQVPIIPKEKIKPILSYLSNFTELIGEMGLKQINQLETHKELKANEEKLQESEEILSQIIKGSSLPTFVIDKSHIVTHWNKACESLTGITASEMIGTNKQWTAFYSKKRPVMADIIVDKVTGKMVNGYYHGKYQRCVLIDGAYQAEDFFPHLGKDGKWLFFTAAPLKNRKGEIIGAIETLQDVTERKQAEKVIIYEQSLLHALMDNIPDFIYFKDEKNRFVRVNKASGEDRGITPEDFIGKTDFDIFTEEAAKKCFADDDRVMKTGKPLINRIEKITYLNGMERWFSATKVPRCDEKGKIIGTIGITRDITQRKQAEQKIKQGYEKLQRTMETTIYTISKIIETRDPYTAGHQNTVSQLAVAIAQEMKLPEDKIEGIRIAALVHDIGKINIPAEILSKPSKLNEMEFSLIKNHPKVGYDILRKIDFSWPVAKIVLQHHERIDGSGYPQGLKGDEMMLEAKILGVADVVEAMSSHRPYRPSLGIDKALEEISKNKGILYDPKVVDACIRLFKKKEFKF